MQLAPGTGENLLRLNTRMSIIRRKIINKRKTDKQIQCKAAAVSKLNSSRSIGVSIV